MVVGSPAGCHQPSDDVGEGAGGRLLVARGGMESFAAGGAHAVSRG